MDHDKNAEQVANIEAAKAEGYEPSSPNSHFYKTSRGDVYRYPGDHTGASWLDGPAAASYERAKDLPED